MVAILQLRHTQKARFAMLDKLSLQISEHMLLFDCKITVNRMENLWPQCTTCTCTHSHTGGIRKLLHYHRMGSFVNNAYFWHLSSSLKKEKHLSSKWVFSSPHATVQGAQSLPEPEPPGQAEEAVLTVWVYSWKKRTMWVLFTDWLWKHVSREQSCLSPAALRGFLVCPQVL